VCVRTKSCTERWNKRRAVSAAKRRKNAAHGVSRGWKVGQEPAL